ncbi:hypothetical protein P9222_02085 [Paenibacillus amylolyticus]|nr:hypothetical protein [Paenibacillus amylolyticus]WFR63226.1 hypothetical protein P9222_02085 [Paenibacillus amylolyticus]
MQRVSYASVSYATRIAYAAHVVYSARRMQRTLHMPVPDKFRCASLGSKFEGTLRKT